MAFKVRVLADSLAPSGKRLTTYECTYWRCIHEEVLTHRMLSRSSGSSRAIPTITFIERVMDDPFIPAHIGKNQRGMQAGEQLPEAERLQAVEEWLKARDNAVASAEKMRKLGVHKQVVNRLLQPWMWITVLITGTEWNNFWALRDHEAAEPHFQDLARVMRRLRDASKPVLLAAGQWHRPLWTPLNGGHEDDVQSLYDNFPIEEHEAAANKISIGRCARVSYLTHDGRRDINEDIRLYNDLMVKRPLHASPAEHVAQALAVSERHGNFVGWKQYRKTLPFEYVEG